MNKALRLCAGWLLWLCLTAVHTFGQQLQVTRSIVTNVSDIVIGGDLLQYGAVIQGFGNLTRGANNPLWSPAAGMASTRDPGLAYWNGKFWMAAFDDSGSPSKNTAITMHVSTNGTNWSNVGVVFTNNPVAGLADSGDVFSPALFAEGSTLYLFYSGVTNHGNAYGGVGFNIFVATSTDGTNFTRVSNGIPAITYGAAWETGNVWGNEVTKQGGTYVMLYSSANSTQIGRATATSITGQWTKDANNPVITAPANWVMAEEPAILKISDNLFYVFVDCGELTAGNAFYYGGYYVTTNISTGNFSSAIDLHLDGGPQIYDLAGIGGTSATLMTNGTTVLFAYTSMTNALGGDDHATNGSTRRISTAYLTPGKVPAPRATTNVSAVFDAGTGAMRILESPIYLDALGKVTVAFGSGPPTVETVWFKVMGQAGGSPNSLQILDVGGNDLGTIASLTLGTNTNHVVWMDIVTGEWVGQTVGVRVDLISGNVALNSMSIRDDTGFVGDTTVATATIAAPVKGDLQVSDGFVPQTVSVGANGLFLVADSTKASGVSWQNRTNNVTLTGSVSLDKTVSSTTGTQTINKTTGTILFAASGQSLTVNNSLVTTNSIIMATVYDDDTTAKSCIAKGAAGSFTLKLNAAATAQCRVNFLVTN